MQRTPDALGERGIGILVTEAPRTTTAHHSQRDPQDVRELRERLLARVSRDPVTTRGSHPDDESPEGPLGPRESA